MTAKEAREKFATQVNSEILAAVRSLAQSEGRQLQSLVEEALADLIENFETGDMHGFWRLAMKMAGNTDPDGKAPLDMRATFTDREAARASRRVLLDWQPERIIIAHGRWYPENGTAELARAFRWLD